MMELLSTTVQPTWQGGGDEFNAFSSEVVSRTHTEVYTGVDVAKR